MKHVLIAGIGFAGLAAAHRFQEAGWRVTGLTHSEESAARLGDEPFESHPCDISNASATAALDLHGTVDVAIHCASSGRRGADAYRSVYVEGVKNLLASIQPKRLIFTSSTSVYAQMDGSCVDETSPAEPPRETGRLLLEAERLTLSADGIVARLAGIYGPGRSVLLRKFFSGEAVIEGDGSRVINQIHRDDIASALLSLAEQGQPGIYNVVDDHPIPQRDVYAWLAAYFQCELPPFGPMDTTRKRGWTSKRVSNALLRKLGWQPQWPSFFDAVKNQPELVELAREQVADKSGD